MMPTSRVRGGKEKRRDGNERTENGTWKEGNIPASKINKKRHTMRGGPFGPFLVPLAHLAGFNLFWSASASSSRFFV